MSEASTGALDSNVLVLNRNYYAIRVITARRAFSLLSQMREHFPAGGDGDYVRTVSFWIRVPRIIRLLFYDRLPRRTVKFNRRNIFARDGTRCQYCGRRFPTSELSLDHVVPRHRGGGATWENIVCACTECNVRKGGRLPEEAGMRLVRRPEKPTRPPLMHVRVGNPKYRSWRFFVDEMYWSVELE